MKIQVRAKGDTLKRWTTWYTVEERVLYQTHIPILLLTSPNVRKVTIHLDSGIKQQWRKAK